MKIEMGCNRMSDLQTLTERVTGIVGDVMTREVQSALENAPVRVVARQMSDQCLRHIVIIDRRRTVVGVISQRDLLKHFLAEPANENPTGDEKVVDALLSRSPVTIAAELELAKAALILATNKIGCLPVVNQRKHLIGVLSSSDLVRRLAGGEQAKVESEYEFYVPSSGNASDAPAFVRRATGDLVIPLECLGDDIPATEHVLLGYNEPNGCILVKLVPNTRNAAGAIPATWGSKTLLIPAFGFISRFPAAGKTAAFKVSTGADKRLIVLSPRNTRPSG